MTDNDVASLFAAQGPLARALPGYRVRTAQIEMSQAVADAIAHKRTVVLEAGTGVGKTAAYLVPAMLLGGKVIISTGTKALQDQLFNRDLPHIQQALALPLTAALLKGRSNYVCWHYLQRANEDASLLASQQEVRDLGHINRFAPLTTTGDKAECAQVPESASVWSRVTSTRENCLGSDCPDHGRCFVLRARRQAQDADVVVVNHHLFFADVMLREEGIQELLPQAQTLVFDEAHQLPDTATLFFGQMLSSGQLLELSRDTKVLGLSHARDAASWQTLTQALDKAIKDVRLCFEPGSSKLAQPSKRASGAFWSALSGVQLSLHALHDAVSSIHSSAAATIQDTVAKEAASLARRASEALQFMDDWSGTGATASANSGQLFWLDIGHVGWQLHRTPISVADLFRRQRLGDADAQSQDKAWVFTSATLAVKQNFELFQQALGLEDAHCQTWASPYAYEQQAMLYVPEKLPPPSSAGFASALVDEALPLIQANEGRAFLLCTSLRGVEQLSALLKQGIQAQGLDLVVLTQGDAPRAMLLDEFRRIGKAVLVGSHSFWEGIDVKGDALSLVIIDKLPFAPPDDPLLTRRLELLSKQGGNPFMDYQVPQAIIALKQGAGRLIRSENDRGVLMIGDTRLVEKPYGRRIWQSLPPMKRSRKAPEVEAFLRQLKQAGCGTD